MVDLIPTRGLPRPHVLAIAWSSCLVVASFASILSGSPGLIGLVVVVGFVVVPAPGHPHLPSVIPALGLPHLLIAIPALGHPRLPTVIPVFSHPHHPDVIM